MAKIRLDVDEETYAGLIRLARECDVSVEALLDAVAGRRGEGQTVSPEVLEIIRRQIRDYAPVFHRLAQ